jgi:ATP-dependent helicase Lhr and Lhr-like helicase
MHRAIDDWFAARNWQAFEFQQQVWHEAWAGHSGLLHATTGSGKTYAVWMAALGLADHKASGVQVIWITPMRALAGDTTKALNEPLAFAAISALLPAKAAVEQRTGDTPSAQRARQAKQLPFALVTTPESLTLLLTRPDARAQFAQLRMVIVDEWHELMGNKRGIQTQLALGRLQSFVPRLCVWGLSATLGNLNQAMESLVGKGRGVLVQGKLPKAIAVDTLLPANTERFPWGGHLGLRMLQPVVDQIEASTTCLVFTNTRSQAELWYQALLNAKPQWAGHIALHHGSLDKEVRQWVEQGLKEGQLKAVVCTSSLDLGVDFSPVQRVLQIGSAKGVARLMQRAGRAGHSPGQVSRISLVPTNALELIESAAAQDAVHQRLIEPRQAPNKPLDVLVQHMVSMAIGEGFLADELFQQVRQTPAYSNLEQSEFDWCLMFVVQGGASLQAYPDYHRVIRHDDGYYRVSSPQIARRHAMSVGTIVSDAMMTVKYFGGGNIGSIEEGFISRLKKGDRFVFAGRVLELIRTQDMVVYVKRAISTKGAVPRWNGGKMPLSSELAACFLARLEQATKGQYNGPEMAMAKPLLELQQRWSALPTRQHLVVESLVSKEGHHLFVYPFAGRNVHIGLSSLLAWRFAKTQPSTFSISVSDCGFELLSPVPLMWSAQVFTELLDTNNLLQDVLESLNSSELAQRRFREIARIAGLIFQGFPGAPRSTKQLQASSSLFFEVFRKYDPDNALLGQAHREVLEQELQLDRLQACLLRMQAQQLCFIQTRQPTPFAFPLMVERLRESLSSEKLDTRIKRMLAELEQAAAA